VLEDLSRSELAVYVGSGLFVIVVFATALIAIGRATPISFNTWTTVAIMTGFTLFLGSYFVSMFVWDWLQGDRGGS
jgi:hypothetical protein